MTYDEVTEIIGKPQRYRFGGSVMLMQWDLKSGDIFQMTFWKSVLEKNSYASNAMRVISSKTQSEEDNWVDIELSGDESWEDYCLPQQ